jgi:hypothetical protein
LGMVEGTYGLVVVVADGLAHELRHPVVLAVLRLNSGDYERHVGVLCCCESAD